MDHPQIYWNKKSKDYDDEYRKYGRRYEDIEYINLEVQKAWIMYQEERLDDEIQDKSEYKRRMY